MRLAQDHESPRGSSTEGDSVRMEQNHPRQENPVGQAEPPRAAPEAPNAQNTQVECLLSMKEMFDQLVTTLRREHPAAPPVATPSRAPIDKLAQHRASTFTGVDESHPKVAEYWLQATTRILSKQRSCSDEHKLECGVTLLVDEALNWWETTTLTAHAEDFTWEFFVKEFKKKYISEQYLDECRKKFLYLRQGSKPIEQYAREFCKYCKYGSEYIKTEERKCQKFVDGLNDELGPMFTALGVGT
ncbi:hypothetical protein V6N13_005637 [Hibiscus sabdariffa]